MRHIRVTVPTGKRDAVLELLDEEDLDYAVTEEAANPAYDVVAEFPVSKNRVEPIIDALADVGIGRDSHVVVVDAETVVSEEFEGYGVEDSADDAAGEQISRQELIARAEELTPAIPVYLAMTLLSAIVATVGLLLDSPAVVVGSMVIAPLVGPAMASAIGTIVEERGLFLVGVKYQVAGVIVGVAGAAAFAWLLQTLLIVPPGTQIQDISELAERISPDLLLLPVALAAGAAGVLSLAMGFSMAIVGVMIAAALVPPIAAAGIAIAWGLPTAALGSGTIVLLNLLGINLAGLVTLWLVGYRPGHRFEIRLAHRHLVRRVAVLGVGILLLTALLAGVAYTTYQVSAFEATAEREAQGVLENYEDLEVVGVTTELKDSRTAYTYLGPFREGSHVAAVTVEIAGPPGAYDPVVADRLYGRINDHTPEPTPVRVRFLITDNQDEPPVRDHSPARGADRFDAAERSPAVRPLPDRTGDDPLATSAAPGRGSPARG